MSEIDWKWTIETTICSQAELAAQLIRQIVEQLQATNWSKKEQLDIHLCLEEAFMNAIKHGNDNDTSKCVDTQCWLNAETFRIQIADEGPGFDQEAVPDPTADENLTNTSGRGLALMNFYMDKVIYNDSGNQVLLEKYRNPEHQD